MPRRWQSKPTPTPHSVQNTENIDVIIFGPCRTCSSARWFADWGVLGYIRRPRLATEHDSNETRHPSRVQHDHRALRLRRLASRCARPRASTRWTSARNATLSTQASRSWWTPRVASSASARSTRRRQGQDGRGDARGVRRQLGALPRKGPYWPRWPTVHRWTGRHRGRDDARPGVSDRGRSSSGRDDRAPRRAVSLDLVERSSGSSPGFAVWRCWSSR